MRRLGEVVNLADFLSPTHPEDIVFVLRKDDPVAADIIREWTVHRIADGLNQPGDPEIRNALRRALLLEAEHAAMTAPGPKQPEWR